MAVKQEVNCPVCDSKSYRVLYEAWVDENDPKKLYGAATGIQGTQRIVKCNDCGMIYENPRFPKEVILEGYINTEQSLHDSQYKNRVKSFYNALEKLKEHLPMKGGRVLDIGTAGGAFLEAATQFGYDAYGLEPSLYLSQEGNKRGLKIMQGTIDENSFPDKFFDIICLWDVIEHLVEPKDALLKIKRMLKPEGVLLLNYPDIGTWMAKITGKRFWWILSVHLHHFDRKTITKICDLTGYKVFLFKPYWQTLDFGYLIDMAVRYRLPLAQTFKQILPNAIKNIPVSYFASQTTALARLVNE